ncbi:hypothetical protein O3G_MSEX012315 [Manduca sexta]|uniref:Uncharacterized protein n=1 Tax=Manduca sexta TaxID=7130 RepID=A0A921ZPB7_MANSE|nr:hypothetical protein O3G_MSEX012315 [Manduca sexta]
MGCSPESVHDCRRTWGYHEIIIWYKDNKLKSVELRAAKFDKSKRRRVFQFGSHIARQRRSARTCHSVSANPPRELLREI